MYKPMTSRFPARKRDAEDSASGQIGDSRDRLAFRSALLAFLLQPSQATPSGGGLSHHK